MAIGSDAAMAVAFFVSTASVVWSAAFAWSRWLARPRESIAAFPEHQEYLEIRIARLERTVAALTGEMERLGETQRAVGQLLAERLPLPAMPQRAAGDVQRVDTPH